MSEDIQGGRRVPPRREEPPYDDDYGPESDYLEAPPFPGTVTAAGVIWIIYGCLVLLSLAATLFVIFVLAANANVPAQANGAAVGGLVEGALLAMVIYGLIAAAFLFVGVQSVRGTARDTLGNGVGSIILGVLGLGVVGLNAAIGQYLQAAGVVVGAVLLLTAGILALVGRSPYKLWRRAQRDQRERERTERIERRRFRE